MFFGRGRNKVKVDYGFDDIYKWYKEESKNPLDKKIARNIIIDFNNEVLKSVVFEGHDHSLGGRLGSIRIRKFDNNLKLNKKGEIANKLKPDWPKTYELWNKKYPGKSPKELKEIKNKPLVYHLNEHTDGYVFKWYWDKITSNVKNQTAYSFEPIRTIKREAAKAWKNIPGLRDIYYE